VGETNPDIPLPAFSKTFFLSPSALRVRGHLINSYLLTIF